MSVVCQPSVGILAALSCLSSGWKTDESRPSNTTASGLSLTAWSIAFLLDSGSSPPLMTLTFQPSLVAASLVNVAGGRQAAGPHVTKSIVLPLGMALPTAGTSPRPWPFWNPLRSAWACV